MDVSQRVALVTGASSGIGRAVAERLAGAGATVVVHGRDATRTAEVARLVGGQGVLGDLAAPGGAAAVVADAVSRHGGVDVLVASAGTGWSGPFTTMDPEAITALVAADLTAQIELVHAVLPGMLQRGRGHLVLLGSIAGRTGVAGEAVYAACKAGVDVFAASLREELHGTGVGVTVVVPGAVETPFFARRGRPYDRRVPRPVPAAAVADRVVAAVAGDRAEVVVPGWLRLPVGLRAVAPGLYRRLSARFGEPVRADPRDRWDGWGQSADGRRSEFPEN